MNAKDRQRIANLVGNISEEFKGIQSWIMVMEERMIAIEDKLEIEDGSDAAIERIKAKVEEEKGEINEDIT